MKKLELITLVGVLSAISITGCGNDNQVVSNNSVEPVTEIVSDNIASVNQDELNELNAENEALKKNINDLEAQITEDEAYYQSSLDFGIEETPAGDVEIIEILDEDRLILQDANIREKDSIDSEWIDYLLRYSGISEENYIHVYGKTSNEWYEIHYITDESTGDYTVAYVPGKALSDSVYVSEAKMDEEADKDPHNQSVTQQQQQTQQPTQQQQNQNPPQNNEPVDPNIDQQYQDMIDNGQIIVADPSDGTPADDPFGDW